MQNAISFETSAKYAFLADYESGQVLYQKNAAERMHPSSMTKIMTAYVVFDEIKAGNINLDDVITISAKARAMDGSRMFLEAGSKVTVEELLTGMIVQSGNDAAVALAEAVSDTEEQFAVKMNEYAKKLGLVDTNYENCTGLSSENHYTTAIDIYKLSHSLLDHFSGFYNIFGIAEYTHNNIKQTNRNMVLGKFGADGIKTGHTDAGGYGVAISAEQNKQRLIAVINGLSSEAVRLQESIKILDYGFNDFVLKKILTAGDPEYNQQVTIRYGAHSKVTAILPESISLYMLKGEAQDFDIVVRHFDNIKAPIEQGEVLGKVVVKDADGNEVATEDLVANESIAKASFFQRLWLNIKYLLGWE